MSDLSGRRLSTNTLWNLLGGGIPLIFALVTIPFIVDALGTERLGVLLLIWALIGYLGIFDLGIGRALTQMTAERIGTGRTGEIPGIVWSGLLMISVLGLVGGGLLAAFAESLVENVLWVPDPYQAEAFSALRLVALVLPLSAVSGGLGAVLAGHQKFFVLNALRVPISAITFFGQAVVASIWPDLVAVVATLIVARMVNAGVLFWFTWRLAPLDRVKSMWHRPQLCEILRFGGWVTVSNLVGPLMVYLDRFVIGAVVSMSSVAYYATPHEVVTRLMVVPGGIVGVLFPTFATEMQKDRGRVARLFSHGVMVILLLLLPPTLLLVGFAEPLLNTWLGLEFAAQSAVVLQILAVGILVNSLAQVPFALLQSAGRPDLTAKLHLFELVPYILCLIWWTQIWGIWGAALAWSLRASVDGIALAIMAKRQFVELGHRFFSMTPIALVVGATLVALGFDGDLILKAVVAGLGLVCTMLLIWLRYLTPEERQLLMSACASRLLRVH